MALKSDAVAGATIELLEARLNRLTYLLTGDSAWTGEPIPPSKPDTLDETVSRHLLCLEKELEKLSRTVPAVRDVIQLRACFLSPYPTLPTFPLSNPTLAQPQNLSQPPSQLTE